MDGRGATGELGLVCPHRAGAFAAPQPAAADTATTAAIVAGAAAIVGALVYDANNRPYYVRNGHRYYVTRKKRSTRWRAIRTTTTTATGTDRRIGRGGRGRGFRSSS